MFTSVGAGDRLVGDTEYCDYPAEAKKVAKIGDTMHPSVERIIALKPQIVLVSTASQLEAFTKQLDQQQIAVYVTNPQSLDDIFRSIQTLGDLFGEHDRATKLVADLRQRADAVEAATKQTKPVKVFYQLSGEPLYTIGRESYLTDLVRRAGGISVTADVATGFPAIQRRSGAGRATGSDHSADRRLDGNGQFNRGRVAQEFAGGIEQSSLQNQRRSSFASGARDWLTVWKRWRALHPEAFK